MATVWCQWSSFTCLWIHAGHMDPQAVLTYRSWISRRIAMPNTYVSSYFLWISLQCSPPPPLQASSYKPHCKDSILGFSPRSWNTLPEPPYSFLWLRSICWGCMPVIYTIFCSPPGPQAKLLTDWTSPLEQHAQNQTQHLKICSSSRVLAIDNYPGTQATQPHPWLFPLYPQPSYQNPLN